MNKRIYKEWEDIYPLTLIQMRFGGKYIAFNCEEDAVKEQIGKELTINERVQLSNEIDEDIWEWNCEISDEENCDILNVPEMDRVPYVLPTVELKDFETIDELINSEDFIDKIQLKDYKSHPAIKAELSN